MRPGSQCPQALGRLAGRGGGHAGRLAGLCPKPMRTMLASGGRPVHPPLLVGSDVLGRCARCMWMGCCGNILAKGNAWLASAVLWRAASMVDLLTWSYAPMPSTERTVRVGSVGPASVANCKLCSGYEPAEKISDHEPPGST